MSEDVYYETLRKVKPDYGDLEVVLVDEDGNGVYKPFLVKVKER